MITLPFAALTVSMVLLAGYDNGGADPVKNRLQQQSGTSSANERPGRMAAADRDDYLKTTRRDLDQLSNQIDALRLKANKSGASLKASLEKKIERFQDDHKNLEEKWKQAKEVSESNWQEFKLSFNTAMEKLQNAVHAASR